MVLNCLPGYNHLLRWAHNCTDRVDNFDLCSEDPIGLASFMLLEQEARISSRAFVFYVRRFSHFLMKDFSSMSDKDVFEDDSSFKFCNLMVEKFIDQACGEGVFWAEMSTQKKAQALLDTLNGVRLVDTQHSKMPEIVLSFNLIGPVLQDMSGYTLENKDPSQLDARVRTILAGLGFDVYETSAHEKLAELVARETSSLL